LFGSRVTPSSTFDVLSESFNKAQLVLTIGGLTAAIAIVKPMVMTEEAEGTVVPIDLRIETFYWGKFVRIGVKHYANEPEDRWP
jgi:hypothetical protein